MSSMGIHNQLGIPNLLNEDEDNYCHFGPTSVKSNYN